MVRENVSFIFISCQFMMSGDLQLFFKLSKVDSNSHVLLFNLEILKTIGW